MRTSGIWNRGFPLAVSLALGAALPALADGNPEIIRLIERTRGPEDALFIDNGAPGPSLGDRVVFTSDLFTPGGRRVGRTGADCMIVRIDAEAPPEAQQVVQCLISAQLPGGQLTVQGLAQGLDNVFAITGGTGVFRKARGQVRAVDRVPLVEAELTIQLLR